MKCRDCGRVIPSGAKFCAYCGNQLQKSPATSVSQISPGSSSSVPQIAHTGFPGWAKLAMGFGLPTIVALIIWLAVGIADNNVPSNTPRPATNSPKWNYSVTGVKMAIPLDVDSKGTLDGVMAISAGKPARIFALTSDGRLKWSYDLQGSHNGHAPYHLAPIDYDLDGKLDEVLLDIRGNVNEPGVIVIGQPEVYTYNLFIFDSNGKQLWYHQYAQPEHAFLPGMSLKSPRGNAEDANRLYEEMMQKYGDRAEGVFLDENFKRVDLDRNGKFDYIISIRESRIAVTKKLGLQPPYLKAAVVNVPGVGVTTAPSSPQNLRVSDSGVGYVNLTWDAPSSNGGSGILNYKIHRGISQGGEILHYTTTTSGTTFRDINNIENGTTYYVTAVNAIGESPLSNEVELLPQASVTAPATIYVPDNYPTIQAAVDAASSGDSIIVRDGIYKENIDVTKDNLTIKSQSGAGRAIVQAVNPNDHVFGIVASGVTLSGFTVVGGGPQGAYPNFPAGISLGDIDTTTQIFPGPKANRSTISNNILLNNYYGIRLVRSDNNAIVNNIIENNVAGISLYYYNERNRLINNVISNNAREGIYLRSNNNTLDSNNILNNKIGIFLEDAQSNVAYLNNFIGNTHNFALLRSTSTWNSLGEMSYTYKSVARTSYLGNYWSNYTGSDADGGGIGDTPYGIDQDRDNYPLLEPFENYVISTSSDTLTPMHSLPQLAGDVVIKFKKQQIS